MLFSELGIGPPSSNLHYIRTENESRQQRFNPDLLDLIPPEQLDATLAGGAHPYEFEHESYWRQVCARAGVNGDGSRFDPLPAPAENADKPVDAAEDKAVAENGNGKAVDGTEPEVAVIEPAPSGTDVTSSPEAATPASPPAPAAASETTPAAEAAGTETSQEEEAGAGTQPQAGAELAPQSQLDPDPASAPAGGASKAEAADSGEAPGAVDPERLRELRQQAIGCVFLFIILRYGGSASPARVLRPCSRCCFSTGSTSRRRRIWRGTGRKRNDEELPALSETLRDVFCMYVCCRHDT